MNYTYKCSKCKKEFTTDHSPKDYRVATGRFVTCCSDRYGGIPMTLIKTEG
jgi:DNA-directed RNA polymerase subunit RPC12/RpoP